MHGGGDALRNSLLHVQGVTAVLKQLDLSKCRDKDLVTALLNRQKYCVVSLSAQSSRAGLPNHNIYLVTGTKATKQIPGLFWLQSEVPVGCGLELSDARAGKDSDGQDI